MERDLWNQFSEHYDEKVFSLTRFLVRRKQILEKIDPGLILNLGCGPTHYLNIDLIDRGNYVIATDFCQAMLDVAKRKFTHPNLEYVLADSNQLPFQRGTFDTIVSINSILPSERKDTYLMGEEIYRTLKHNKVLVAFLCSYDSAKRAKRNLGAKIELDEMRCRVMDTVGWQCFQTPSTIHNLMNNSGFSRHNIEKVFLRTKEEIEEFKRLYSLDTSKSLIYEYLVVAHK